MLASIYEHYTMPFPLPILTCIFPSAADVELWNSRLYILETMGINLYKLDSDDIYNVFNNK